MKYSIIRAVSDVNRKTFGRHHILDKNAKVGHVKYVQRIVAATSSHVPLEQNAATLALFTTITMPSTAATWITLMQI
jgi:hypothetical protein